MNEPVNNNEEKEEVLEEPTNNETPQEEVIESVNSEAKEELVEENNLGEENVSEGAIPEMTPEEMNQEEVKPEEPKEETPVVEEPPKEKNVEGNEETPTVNEEVVTNDEPLTPQVEETVEEAEPLTPQVEEAVPEGEKPTPQIQEVVPAGPEIKREVTPKIEVPVDDKSSSKMEDVTPRIDTTDSKPAVEKYKADSNKMKTNTLDGPPKMEAVKSEEKPEAKEKGGKKSTGLIVIGIILVAAVALMVINPNTIMELISPKETTKETNTTEKTEKITTVSDALKQHLNTKVGRLLYDEDLLDTGVVSGYRFREFLLKRDLTDEEKQYIVLETTKYESLESNWQDIPAVKELIEKEKSAAIEAGQEYSESNTISEFGGYATKKDLEKDYKNVFGTDLKNISNTVGVCPVYNYYQDKELFVAWPARCGGTSAEMYMVYPNKYERDGDTAYLYLSVGVYTPDGVYSDFELGSDTKNKYIISGTTPAGNKVEVTEKNSNEQPIITENNYQQFSQYKFTFKKLTDDEFYFSKVEQLKETTEEK